MDLRERVWQSLRGVRYPGYTRDIVSFGLVRRVEVGEGEVRVLLGTGHLAPHVRQAIEAQVRHVLRALPGVAGVEVEIAAVDRPQHRTPRQEGDRPPFLAPESRTVVLPVASGKGGVGKSTVTVNLAVAVAQRGKRVGVIDADVYGFSIPRMLGIRGTPRVAGRTIVPLERAGVRVISVGMLVGTEQAVIWRGPLLHKTLTTFIGQVAWGELDYLFVDLPPGTGDVPLTIAQELPRARMIVVTTPQDAAVEVAVRAARMAETVNMDVAGVIENMSFYRPDPGGPPVYVFGQGGGRRLARLIDAPLLAEIPLDPLVRESGDRGEPVVLSAPASPASRAFLEAAEQLLRAGESAPVPS